MEKHIKVNVIWSIATLIALLILTLTWRVPLPSKSADMMSFAATMCSMALAIIAIFQSLMYAVDASREKREASAFNARTSTLLESIDRQIPDLGRHVLHVSEQLTALKGFESQGPAGSLTRQEETGQQENNNVDTLILRASAAGLFALRAAVLCVRFKKPIVLNLSDEQLIWHTVGFISGLSATNWLNFEIGNATLSVTYLNQTIIDSYDKIVNAFDKQQSGIQESILSARDYLLKHYDVAR